MEEALLLAPLAFVIVALMAGALLKVFLKNINVPYTVGLFLLGMVAGTLNVKGYLNSMPMISDAIKVACDIDPDLILNIFLPILIFSAVYEIDIHIFRKSLVNSTLLAVPGMVISIALTAMMMLGIAQFAPQYINWNIIYALMFGALISATDPVAVVALLGELGVSKRFSTLIDGESLLNDGTGIVIFMLLYAPFTTSVKMASPSPVASFLVVVIGGLIIGYLMARLFLFYVTRSGVKGDSMLQASVMILLSYLTFIFAQDIFKLSGVIALVAFGLVVAYHSSAKLDEKTQTFIKEFWKLLSYIANTLIFIIIGIIIAEKVDITWLDVGMVLIVYVGINMIRMVMIIMLYPLLKRFGYGLSKRESLILTWGALRGALGLTLALMVSHTPSIAHDVSRQILLLTSGIVTLTLVINATTIKWMLNALGLVGGSDTRRLIDAEIRSQLHSQSCQYLEKLRVDSMMSGADWTALEGALPDSVETPESAPHGGDIIAGLRMQLLSFERHITLSMFNRGELSFAAHRKLVDLYDQMIDLNGERPMDQRGEMLTISHSDEILCRPDREGILGWFRSFHKNHGTSAAVRCEVAYGVMVSLRRLLMTIPKMEQIQLLNEEQRGYLDVIKKEIRQAERGADSFLRRFEKELPKLYRSVITSRCERMLHSFERRKIEEFAESGAIDEERASELIEELHQRTGGIEVDYSDARAK